MLQNYAIKNRKEDYIVAMAADEPKRVAHFVKALKRFSPKEVVLSGVVAMVR